MYGHSSCMHIMYVYHVCISCIVMYVYMCGLATVDETLYRPLQEFDESYVQTGPGQLYAWSSQSLAGGEGGPQLGDEGPLTLRCNHTLAFEAPQDRQGPLLQLLKLTGISGLYSTFTLSLHFQITATLLLPGQTHTHSHTLFLLTIPMVFVVCTW